MVVKYFINKKSKNDTVNIYARFIDSNRFDEKSKTDLNIPKDIWSDKKQKIKTGSTYSDREFIDNHLTELRNYLLKEYNKLYNSKKYIPKKWLRDEISKYFGRTPHNLNENYIYLTDWINDFVTNAHNKLKKDGSGNISTSTQKNYISIYKRLVRFEDHANYRYRFEEIDYEYYENLIYYLREIECLNNNTIGSTITKLRHFCTRALRKKNPVNLEYKDFVSPSNETYDTYLNENEIKQVVDYDFSDNKRLENVRDLFVIGLRTGLRISDFLRLKDLNLDKGYINITTHKTLDDVIIPMHNDIKNILNKNNGGLPRPISNQKFNEYVKEVCKTIGFDEVIKGGKNDPETNRKVIGMYPKYELIASHTCRRSFATNLYGKYKNLTIMAITGHKKEEQFLKYIKITKKEHAKTIKDDWDKENNKT